MKAAARSRVTAAMGVGASSRVTAAMKAAAMGVAARVRRAARVEEQVCLQSVSYF